MKILKTRVLVGGGREGRGGAIDPEELGMVDTWMDGCNEKRGACGVLALMLTLRSVRHISRLTVRGPLVKAASQQTLLTNVLKIDGVSLLHIVYNQLFP